jgi:hypothetical protein
VFVCQPHESGELYANVCLLSRGSEFKQHTRTSDGIASLDSDQSLDFCLFFPKNFLIPFLNTQLIVLRYGWVISTKQISRLHSCSYPELFSARQCLLNTSAVLGFTMTSPPKASRIFPRKIKSNQTSELELSVLLRFVL